MCCPMRLARAPGRGAWIGVLQGPELEEARRRTGKLKGAGAGLQGRGADDPRGSGRADRKCAPPRGARPAGSRNAQRKAYIGSDRIAEHARGGAHQLAGPCGRCRARTVAGSSTRLIASGWTPKARALPGSACPWTARPCLWHWAATMSSTWRSPTRASAERVALPSGA